MPNIMLSTSVPLSTPITNLTTGTPVKISNNSLAVNNLDDLRITSAVSDVSDNNVSALSFTGSTLTNEFDETKKRIAELEKKVEALQNMQSRFFC